MGSPGAAPDIMNLLGGSGGQPAGNERRQTEDPFADAHPLDAFLAGPAPSDEGPRAAEPRPTPVEHVFFRPPETQAIPEGYDLLSDALPTPAGSPMWGADPCRQCPSPSRRRLPSGRPRPSPARSWSFPSTWTWTWSRDSGLWSPRPLGCPAPSQCPARCPRHPGRRPFPAPGSGAGASRPIAAATERPSPSSPHRHRRSPARPRPPPATF